MEQEQVSMRDYVDSRFAEQQRAVDKAEEGINRRLDLLNEFRAQSSDEQKKFALREVTDERLDALTSRIAVLEAQRDYGEGASRERENPRDAD